MIYLSQNDKRWSADKLGSSPLTIGRYGCTTTCISMLSDYFKCYKNPKEIAHNVANYTKDGLIVWVNLKFDRMKFVRREYGRNDAKIDQALKNPNQAVILEVNNRSHWVVALRKTWFGLGSDYLILDPWTGRKEYALKKYHNITGSAFFAKK
jgi:hypothetical protein